MGGGERQADPAGTPSRPCPICGREASGGFFPFCSKRCADVDLHRWLSGVYAIPATEADDEAEPEES
mgnify:CR=1 FL=1